MHDCYCYYAPLLLLLHLMCLYCYYCYYASLLLLLYMMRLYAVTTCATNKPMPHDTSAMPTSLQILQDHMMEQQSRNHMQKMHNLRNEHVTQRQSMQHQFVTAQLSVQQQHAELEKASNHHVLLHQTRHSQIINHMRQEHAQELLQLEHQELLQRQLLAMAGHEDTLPLSAAPTAAIAAAVRAQAEARTALMDAHFEDKGRMYQSAGAMEAQALANVATMQAMAEGRDHVQSVNSA